MKRSLIPFIIVIGSAFTTNAQFSIQRNPDNASAVDILYTPPTGATGSHPISLFQFGLQVPNPQGSTLSATFTPGAPLSALTGGFDLAMGTDYSYQTFVWTPTPSVPTYSNTYDFDGSQVVLGTVVFSATDPNNIDGAIVSAIDYQNQAQYGGSTNNALWAIDIDNTQTDVTQYDNLFYQSATSDAPTTDNDGGVENQRLTLSSTPLPIKLADFTAQLNDKNTVDLNWITFSEHNNKGFDIERSANGRDFTKIGYVASLAENGNSDKELLYAHADEKPLNGNNYYRLKQMDNNNKVTYSLVRLVTVDNTPDITIYPNPANSYVNIKGLKAANAVSIFSVAGQLVFEQDADAPVMQCNVMNLAAGTYTVKVTDAGHNVIFTGKLIKNN